VSSFRLDKYEVTVGRYRQFVNAWNGGAGFTPVAGAGKHAHLNGGQGLVNSAAPADAGTVYETGWVASDSSNIQPTNANLACAPPYTTWTDAPGTQENLPINCVSWYEAYAFCIWDGGFLPSESEWEYAAAGGSQQREYPWGTTAPGTSNQYAVYDCHPSSSQVCTGLVNIAPVGTATLGAGLWGHLDVAGNVEEWNLDWFNVAYVDPCADCAYLTAAYVRLSRGGYFDAVASHLLPTYRDGLTPVLRSNGIGIRCARGP
jgi:formylglycine-generating enzyme required for sulfatase activity